MKKTVKLPTTLWGGFMKGKLDIEVFQNDHGFVYGVLYQTRTAARDRYQDVRKVEIREQRKQPKPRTRPKTQAPAK